MSLSQEACDTLERLDEWNRKENRDPAVKELVQTALNEIDYLLTKISHLERKQLPR